MQPYRSGSIAAFTQLGLVKQAAGGSYVGPDGESLPFWRSVGAHSSRWLVGQPKTYLDELKSGTAFSKGSYSRRALWPGAPEGAGLGAKIMSGVLPALMYAPAALQLVAATQGPAEHRGEGIGGALGGALGTALGMPLGILGSAGGSLLGAELGGRLGHLFDGKRELPELDYDPRRSSTLVTD